MKKTSEYYFQLIYRPVGINVAQQHEEEASGQLTIMLQEKIKEIDKIARKSIAQKIADESLKNIGPFEIKYRIVNVSSTVDPRVKTDPGLNSVITIMHVAYWFEKITL